MKKLHHTVILCQLSKAECTKAGDKTLKERCRLKTEMQSLNPNVHIAKLHVLKHYFKASIYMCVSSYNMCFEVIMVFED